MPKKSTMIQNKERKTRPKKIYNVKKNPNISILNLDFLSVSVFKCECAI